MASPVDALPTEAVAAFVEVARQGSLRRAGETLLLSEQGVRSRLLSLEQHLGVELYRKQRGRRRTTPLTPQGRKFLPHAIAYLHQAEQLARFFHTTDAPRAIHVVASQYLIAYVLIDAVRRFHAAYPTLRVRLSARSEAEIEQTLRDDPEIAFGVAAPYEASPDLEYRHLFSMPWSVIAPPGHPVLKRRTLQLIDVVQYPLIFFERGSTGRQHVAEALRLQNLSADVELEATNTDLIVRMVEAQLGIAIVPLLPSGVVTRGRQVTARSLGEQVRPIQSGILRRRGDPLSTEADAFLRFIEAKWRRSSVPSNEKTRERDSRVS
jgi:DNA-binding transcriptional LysR family regulator